MIEPDEDEDPVRLCAKCGLRRRWSRHRCCRLCAVCLGPRLTRAVLRRKGDQAPKTVVHKPWVERKLQRYQALRQNGASYDEARMHCTSPARTEELLRRLTTS